MTNIVRKSYGVNGPCNAPWNNMYFTVLGHVSPCWKLPGFCDSWSSNRSISDIWNGEKFQMYRDALSKNRFLNRCTECEKDINHGVWPLATSYEKFGVNDNGYPTVIELELSNQCNLECIMCNGNLSSGIRKNREKLPPLPMVYNNDFRIQLKEFLPHIKELRFNGGEPLTQKIVLDICEDVAELNPKLPICVATNGTVYNKRVQHLMDICNIHFNVSIDSLNKEKYESIRINSTFENMMSNFHTFREYRKAKNENNNPKNGIAIMTNPMRVNWQEMVDIAVFARDNNVHLWYTTVLYPRSLALWNLPSSELQVIHNTLKQELKTKTRLPVQIYHLIDNQIANWLLDAVERENAGN